MERAPGLTVGRGDDTPTQRDLLLIFGAAVLLRILIALATALPHGMSIGQLALLRDGESYTRVASALLGRPTELTVYDRRVFIGFPALIAPFAAAGVSPGIAGLLLVWISSGAAAVLTASIFRSRWLGWVVAVVVPSWLLYSSVVMTEAPQLALELAGILVAMRGRPLLGGILLGCAGLVRPVACFAVLGILVWEWRRGRLRDGIVATGASGVTVLAGMLLYRQWSGDALQNVRVYANDSSAYGGQLFQWPFASLIQTPLLSHTSPAKIAYVWTTVLIVLVGCWLGVRRWLAARREHAPAAVATRDLAALAVPWLLAHTLYTLCVGRYWGFHEFHRFILPALPPLLWAYYRWIPRRAPGLAALSVVSIAAALYGLSGHLL